MPYSWSWSLARSATSKRAWTPTPARSTIRGGGIDDTLGQIALYLIDRNRTEGSTFISDGVEMGIVGYQIRFFDNGNRVIDSE